MKRKRFAVLGAVIIIFALGVGLGTRMSNSASHAAEQGISDATPPAFVHKGDKFIISQGSQLRSRLVVQQVTVKNSPHVLVLPAAVEADPARTVNILPPVAGKVVKLEVRLGDHVVKGQPLAVIESGDLAQAYADDDKARDALQHAERTLERVRGLHEAGAGAAQGPGAGRERLCPGQGRVQPGRSAAQGNRRSIPAQRRVTPLDPYRADDRKRHRAHDRARRISPTI